MNSKNIVLIVTLLTVGMGGTIAVANSLQETPSVILTSQSKILAEEEENKPRRRQRSQQFQQQLNLSDEQMQQLSAIREKYRPQMERLKQQMQAKGQELSRMMQGNASENDLRRKHQEIINLRQQMGNIRFESMLEMRNILTPEQRQKLAQLLEQRRQRIGRNRPNSGVMP